MFFSHPSPQDPGYQRHVEELAKKIGLSKAEVELELAEARDEKSREHEREGRCC